ncbi:MAG: hypothetical protein WCA89_16155 [Terracidiphilus sp.]|jgi:hypothetical protein
MANQPLAGWIGKDLLPLKGRAYSIFGIAVDRSHAFKWFFHQEKAAFTALIRTTMIPKMLKIRASDSSIGMEGAQL